MLKAKSSQLKAKLGHYLKAVRNGEEVIVQDRDTPIARLIPFVPVKRELEPLIYAAKDPAAPPIGTLTIKGIPFRGTDTLTMLQEDRRRR